MNSGNGIIVRRPTGAQADLAGLSLHPVLQRVYSARPVRDSSELDHSLEKLLPPHTLGGMARAVDLLVQALAESQHILIVGDFDADGATSSALCVRALRGMGATNVSFVVPNRFEYGYGLTPEIVAVAALQDPDVIITVDNGISSVSGVAAARARGIKVLVTDHHLAGAQLPAADAIVNPNLPGDAFASKNLAGVGVAFYVMLGLRARLREIDWFARNDIAEPNLAELLDLVALGTVADVVPLDHNNRILVKQGLARIQAGRCIDGISALLMVGGRDSRRLVASDLAFAVAPRLNAAGRLEDMSLGIECLLADDPVSAMEKARALDALNRERREIEGEMHAQALAAVDKLPLDAEALPACLCLYDENWHQGVIGIVAGRLKERFHRPAIVFARGGNGELKGSARSVPGLHIRDVLDAVATRHPELITRFGGHAMAAGLTLDFARLEEFRRAVTEEVARQVSVEDLNGVVYSDGELSAPEISLETAELLRNAGPWGQGFPEPVFDGEFEVISLRVVGGAHLKLSLRMPGKVEPLDAIAFRQAEAASVVQPGSRLRVAYRIDSNEYRGLLGLQLVVDRMEILSS